MNGRQLSGLSQLERERVDGSRVLPDSRWTEERWRHSGNKRLRRKEGGEKRVEGRRRLRLRIVVQPRASTIGLLFFTLLPCQPDSSSSPLLLHHAIHQSFSKTQGRLQCSDEAISALCDLRVAAFNPRSYGR